MQFIMIFIFAIFAMLFMGISLHFSRYKKRKIGGCNCGFEETLKDGYRSPSCPACSDEKSEMAGT